ncbi:uncharacterized protein LOC107304135 [Oryza brachyantha]|uniref:uncharacterized protein LOC107304135 n=1 Tax=Oryza brachyantha TaxID=4533 RepID=UPI001ADB65F0|nr:uncharacterized protein LOC107304135 [Oryza brachyantha]
MLFRLFTHPANALVAAEMDDGGGRGEEAERWPWWAGASAAQVAAGVAWFRGGRGGTAFAMPFKAFAIATLFVGAGATAVTAGVLAAGVGSVDEMKVAGASIRRWMGAPPRRVEGGDS